MNLDKLEQDVLNYLNTKNLSNYELLQRTSVILNFILNIYTKYNEIIEPEEAYQVLFLGK